MKIKRERKREREREKEGEKEREKRTDIYYYSTHTFQKCLYRMPYPMIRIIINQLKLIFLLQKSKKSCKVMKMLGN